MQRDIFSPSLQHKHSRFNQGTSSLFTHTTKWGHSRNLRQDIWTCSEICQCQQNAAFRRLKAIQLHSTGHKWFYLPTHCIGFPSRPKYLWHHDSKGCQECKTEPLSCVWYERAASIREGGKMCAILCMLSTVNCLTPWDSESHQLYSWCMVQAQ
jgi:hypothetical protein